MKLNKSGEKMTFSETPEVKSVNDNRSCWVNSCALAICLIKISFFLLLNFKEI